MALQCSPVSSALPLDTGLVPHYSQSCRRQPCATFGVPYPRHWREFVFSGLVPVMGLALPCPTFTGLVHYHQLFPGNGYTCPAFGHLIWPGMVLAGCHHPSPPGSVRRRMKDPLPSLARQGGRSLPSALTVRTPTHSYHPPGQALSWAHKTETPGQEEPLLRRKSALA